MKDIKEWQKNFK